MIKTKKVVRHVDEYEKVMCNKCGGSCESSTPMDPKEPIFTGMINCRIRGNYFSDHLEDGVEYKFDLCEKCIKELFDSFKVPVEEGRYPLLGY